MPSRSPTFLPLEVLTVLSARQVSTASPGTEHGHDAHGHGALHGSRPVEGSGGDRHGSVPRQSSKARRVSGICCRVQTSFLRVDGCCFIACTFPRPSVVVNDNQLYSEMRNDRACVYDVTTRMLCFVLQDS